MDLSTVSIESPQIEIVQEDEKKVYEDKVNKHLSRKEGKRYYQAAINGEFSVWKDFISSDLDFIAGHSKYSERFYEEYNLGFDYYLEGDWKKAKFHFENSNVYL